MVLYYTNCSLQYLVFVIRNRKNVTLNVFSSNNWYYNQKSFTNNYGTDLSFCSCQKFSRNKCCWPAITFKYHFEVDTSEYIISCNWWIHMRHLGACSFFSECRKKSLYGMGVGNLKSSYVWFFLLFFLK